MQRNTKRLRVDGVANLVVIGSGKGGVGKSTVSVNLAVALARQGARVGLLDGDAYGPSVPMMLGVRKREAGQGWSTYLPLAQLEKQPPEQKLQPLVRYGVKVMSVGFFIGEEQAVAPIPDVLGMLIRQLIYGVNWGMLDYLLIDLPPGNGEPQATICREQQIEGAILVTTLQDIARIDTAKAAAMFSSVGVPILGVVQNMAGLICPHCGERIDIFPPSNEARAQLDVLPILGEISLDPATVTSGDRGQPIVVSVPESPVSEAFTSLAQQVANSLITKRTQVEEPGAISEEENSVKEEKEGNERED